MRKKYTSLVRILVALAMVASLVGVMAGQAGAQQVMLDGDHHLIGQAAVVSVWDTGSNNDAHAEEELVVTLASAPSAHAATLTLLETGPDTSIFEGAVTFLAVPVDVDGTNYTVDLGAAVRDTVTATYGLVAATTTIVTVDIEQLWYKIGDNVPVTVEDVAGQDSISVAMTSATAADTATATLAEITDGTYKGSVTLVAVGESGGLEVTDLGSDIITATYGAATDTADIDTTDPVTTIDALSAYLTADDVVGGNIVIQGGIGLSLDAGFPGTGSGIVKVDVSTDGGVSWQAVFISATGTSPVNWTYFWPQPLDGDYVIVSRATDAVANVEVIPTDLTVEDVNVQIVTVDILAPAISDGAATREATATDDTNIVAEDGTVELSATVTDATSGVVAVTADLTSIGGIAQVLTQVGTTDVWELAGVGGGGGKGALDTAGNITIPVTATDTAGNTATAVDITFTVEEDTTDPAVAAAVDYERGTQAKVGDDVTITPTATDDLSGIATVVMDEDEAEAVFGAGVALDVTAGLTIVVAADVAVGIYPVTLTATDAAGNTSTTAISVEVVTEYTTYRIDLAAGKNMVSVPRGLASSNIWEALSSIAGDVTKVYTYVGGTPLVSATKEMPADSGEYLWTGDALHMHLLPGVGLIVDMSSAATLVLDLSPIDPTTPPGTLTLGAGWNSIGFASIALDPNMTVGNYLSSLTGKWQVLYDSTWNQARPSVLGAEAIGTFATNLDGDPIVELGQMYWIYLTADGVLVP